MLRAAVPADEDLLWAMLGHASNPEGPANTLERLRSEPELARYVDGWGRPGDVGIVAIDDATGEAVGAAWYRSFAAGEPGYGFVGEETPEVAIGLAEGARGLGLGHALIDALLARAHDEDVAQLSLSVRTTNLRAVRVYEDCGFVDAHLSDDDLHPTLVAPTRPARAPDEELVVRAVAAGDLDLDALPPSAWGAVVARLDEVLHITSLPAFVAEVAGEPVGLVTWRHDLGTGEIEVVGLEAWRRDRGVGGALLRAVRAHARRLGVRRLWLITNNDSTDAMRFYQRRGWQLVAVHRGSADRSRALKPALPLVGEHGIPVHHEVELELRLDR